MAEDKKEKSGIKLWFNGIKGEFKRISWPTRLETAKMTVIVIITSAIVGGIIVGYDFVLSTLYGLLTNVVR